MHAIIILQLPLTFIQHSSKFHSNFQNHSITVVHLPLSIQTLALIKVGGSRSAHVQMYTIFTCCFFIAFNNVQTLYVLGGGRFYSPMGFFGYIFSIRIEIVKHFYFKCDFSYNMLGYLIIPWI